MKLFADENVARDIVAWLRSRGHDVLFAAELQPGASDGDWLVRAEQEQRLILTSDKDFGELLFREGLSSYGVILLRLADLPVADALARLQAIWSIVETNSNGRFIVVTDRKTRVRPLPKHP